MAAQPTPWTTTIMPKPSTFRIKTTRTGGPSSRGGRGDKAARGGRGGMGGKGGKGNGKGKL